MSLITNTDSSILPYNTEQMEYDLDEQMYVLTEKGIRDLTGYDILTKSGSQQKADLNRYRISRDVMNYIKKHSRLDTYKYKKRAIAKDEKTREAFKQALREQAMYYIESGAGSLPYQHGVNIAGSKAIDINLIRGRVLISPYAETTLEQVGLLYTGDLYDFDYEEDGTW